jgi:hypothetical protein
MHVFGVRELKAKLGEYVRKASAGDVVLVTERGKVVAEPRAPLTVRELPPELAGIAGLAEKGLVTLGLPGRAKYPRSPVRCRSGTAIRLLDADREEQ